MESEQVLEISDIILLLIQLKTQSRFFISDSCLTPKSYFIHFAAKALIHRYPLKMSSCWSQSTVPACVVPPKSTPENLISLPLMPSFFQILIYNVEEDKAKCAM